MRQSGAAAAQYHTGLAEITCNFKWIEERQSAFLLVIVALQKMKAFRPILCLAGMVERVCVQRGTHRGRSRESPWGRELRTPEKQHAAGSGARLLRVGEEQDLTIDLVVANGVLAVR